jgi:hypothetical protein
MLYVLELENSNDVDVMVKAELDRSFDGMFQDEAATYFRMGLDVGLWQWTCTCGDYGQILCSPNLLPLGCQAIMSIHKNHNLSKRIEILAEGSPSTQFMVVEESALSLYRKAD